MQKVQENDQILCNFDDNEKMLKSKSERKAEKKCER